MAASKRSPSPLCDVFTGKREPHLFGMCVVVRRGGKKLGSQPFIRERSVLNKDLAFGLLCNAFSMRIAIEKADVLAAGHDFLTDFRITKAEMAAELGIAQAREMVAAEKEVA